jgi:hypothetical protein
MRLAIQAILSGKGKHSLVADTNLGTGVSAGSIGKTSIQISLILITMMNMLFLPAN